MAKAAVAAGADGLLIEVHPNPKEALVDGLQCVIILVMILDGYPIGISLKVTISHGNRLA
jgi:hypothetical protein